MTRRYLTAFQQSTILAAATARADDGIAHRWNTSSSPVAVGADTRPATAAEMCCACSTASQVVPLSPAAAGLYFRMWAQAFPDQPDIGAERLPHHEALHGSHIDDLETVTRRKLTVHGRKLGKINCCGQHHGHMVACRHAPLADPLFDLPATA